MTTQEKIQALIKGEVVTVPTESERKEIQKTLREYKKNITIVLSQLANGY